MRSDFYSLPWAAQQAIRRGEQARSQVSRQRWTIAELEAEIAKLQDELATLKSQEKR